MGPFSIWPVGPDGLRVTCTYGTVLHLHPTCGTRWLVCHVYLWDHPTYGTQRLTCHVYLWDLSPSPSDLWDPMTCVPLVPFVPLGSNIFKKTSMPGSQTRDPEEGMHDLYHCARCLVVLTCLWSCYSIIFSMWILYRLTYIRYFPFKWKQICAR
jgi:hypothetical protein